MHTMALALNQGYTFIASSYTYFSSPFISPLFDSAFAPVKPYELQ